MIASVPEKVSDYAAALLTIFHAAHRKPSEDAGNPALALAAWEAGDFTAYVRASPLLDILDAIMRVFEALGAVPFDPDARLCRPLPPGFSYELTIRFNYFKCI